MLTAEHVRILRLGVEGLLPDRIDKNTKIDIAIFRELYEAGLVEAIDATSFDGPAYLEPRITLAGRAHLNAASSKSWWRAEWVVTALVTVLGGLLVAALAAALF